MKRCWVTGVRNRHIPKALLRAGHGSGEPQPVQLSKRRLRRESFHARALQFGGVEWEAPEGPSD